MHEIRTRPALPKAARLFNLVVAAAMFSAMLGFAAWATVSSFTEGRTELLRGLGGTVIGIAAVTLLMALYGEWKTGEPFQQSSRCLRGVALFGLGMTLLMAG